MEDSYGFCTIFTHEKDSVCTAIVLFTVVRLYLNAVRTSEGKRALRKCNCVCVCVWERERERDHIGVVLRSSGCVRAEAEWVLCLKPSQLSLQDLTPTSPPPPPPSPPHAPPQASPPNTPLSLWGEAVLHEALQGKRGKEERGCCWNNESIWGWAWRPCAIPRRETTQSNHHMSLQSGITCLCSKVLLPLKGYRSPKARTPSRFPGANLYTYQNRTYVTRYVNFYTTSAVWQRIDKVPEGERICALPSAVQNNTMC